MLASEPTKLRKRCYCEHIKPPLVNSSCVTLSNERKIQCRSSSIRDARIADQANSIPDDDRNNHLFIYAIVRADLEMPTGKLAAQAGHAYTDALLDCFDKHPELVERYRCGDNAGSKATLKAKNEAALIRAFEECKSIGVPCALIVDENHILLPHFDGSPIVTALGIGPISRADAKPIVKRFNCV